MTTQLPAEVWIALPEKDRKTRLDYPRLRVVRFSGAALTEGIRSSARFQPPTSRWRDRAGPLRPDLPRDARDPALLGCDRVKKDQRNLAASVGARLLNRAKQTGDDYQRLLVTLPARCGSARLMLQIDMGLGDSVWPPPQLCAYPTLLEFPPPTVLAYPPEAVVAEKLEAMIVLGDRNSRIKDFFDCIIWRAGSSLTGRPWRKRCARPSCGGTRRSRQRSQSD